ncbi:MAG TPA: hypothetical protein VH682_30170, partial [Gemmataceae bacterium]
MLSYPRRSLLALLVVIGTVFPAAAAPAEKPGAKQIAQWIQQLSDNKFSVRESASKKLWAAGSAAEAALEEAMKSDDAEVVRRARDILDKFKWGIYPDTPADIAALIRAYQSAENNGRLDILEKLLQGGPAGLQAVRKIVRKEKDANQRRVLGGLVASKLPPLSQVLEHNDYEKFEALLEIGHEGEFIEHSQYTAYWLLRGKLEERIAHFRNLLAKEPAEKRVAETLAYLYRAKGDLAEARKAAEKSGRADLLEGILYEAADWKALAARPDLAGTVGSAEKWAYRAAFARLAGDRKAFEDAVRELRRFTEPGAEGETLTFVAAKALLLNDRPSDGLDMLRDLRGHETVRFEVLCAQLKYGEAMKLVDQKRPAKSIEQKRLEVLKARTLYLLGEKDKAQELFSHLTEEIKNVPDVPRPQSWVGSLLETEYKFGLKDQAFEHGARALSVSGAGTEMVELHKLYR